MKKFLPLACLLLTSFFLVYSCTSVDLYEKSVTVPGHTWKSSFRPSFEFSIKDTNASYDIFLVLRHTDRYNFNNIYVNLYIKEPGRDSAVKIQKDLLLATNDKGWTGEAMDDIYEHRILLGKLGQNRPVVAGNYQFSVEQVMRQDPLENVLNVGVRVEKK